MFDSDTTLKALPEIAHKYREQEPRAHALVSMLFTALVCAPLLFLFGNIGRVSGGNLSLISGASSRLYSLPPEWVVRPHVLTVSRSLSGM